VTRYGGKWQEKHNASGRQWRKVTRRRGGGRAVARARRFDGVPRHQRRAGSIFEVWGGLNPGIARQEAPANLASTIPARRRSMLREVRVADTGAQSAARVPCPRPRSRLERGAGRSRREDALLLPLRGSCAGFSGQGIPFSSRSTSRSHERCRRPPHRPQARRSTRGVTT